MSDSSSQVWQYCEVIIKLPYAAICYFDMLAVDDIIPVNSNFHFFPGNQECTNLPLEAYIFGMCQFMNKWEIEFCKFENTQWEK